MIKMRVLGIDPGLRKTGFGVIDIIDNKPIYVTSGVICTDSHTTLALRLKAILSGITEVIAASKPDISAVEKVFVNVNPQSTLLLGQARGVAIAACVLHELDVAEYTALQVKQSVVGYGHAEKQQVSKMVKYMLNLDGDPQSDAADALAVALAHMHYSKLSDIFKMSEMRNGRFIK
ncbi:MAG: crossover junction endodeoxyribonuclease RuvC [Proteobacteria bacterium]|jgi:crossover junction endodeoxyribonuclease RuvC|nr:crossover junction endodeoxyribonuclease RuvC [Pseudomonadota bacterium]